MKKTLIVALFLSIMTFSYGFTIQNPTGKFEIAVGYNLSSIYLGMNSIEMQAIYNANEVFYVGTRYMNFNSFGYVSVSRTTGYAMSFNDISLVLGMEFGNFNERFQFVLNLLPGFAFADRKYGNLDTSDPIVLKDTLNNDNFVFFSPSFEFGFNCYLTQNLILNSTLSVKLVKVKDMNWEHRPWLIQLGNEDAFLIYLPVRITWRF
jgi:hypothetical protein